ncbi:Zinc transporter ZupT [Candidatus Kryptobacter tengchongensis]|nr:ZIP family metal transporter [Candidatus Kryptobacter tengchongensis]CUS88622.1 Zinc transporter ZupT [Candidatus Kryptobacter tengchongensis]CUU06526.1 Zinc transporter ZupT [Candidatus Kryptobacter tengchongensis]
MTLLILTLGLIATIAEILGGLIIFFTRKWPQKLQDYMLAFGAGFIVALVLTQLVPESINSIGETAPILIMLGYATLHFFEHAIVSHLHFGEETHTEHIISKTASYSIFLGLFIHAFFDGMSISIGLKFNYVIGLLLFIGVFLHKFPEGMTVASIISASGKKVSTSLLLASIVGFATFAGVLIGLAIPAISEKLTGYFFAFISGVGLYVGTTDLIPEINNSKTKLAPIAVFFGMLFFYMTSDFLHKVIH